VKSKPAKMTEKRGKMYEKRGKMKAKKAKLKGAAASACCVLAALALSGCQSADPASRANRAEYGQIAPGITITGASNTVSVSVTIGDGVYASADGGGDTQSNTPTQTTDTRPDIAVGVGGSTAATGKQ